jgi:hypothetical protein
MGVRREEKEDVQKVCGKREETEVCTCQRREGEEERLFSCREKKGGRRRGGKRKEGGRRGARKRGGRGKRDESEGRKLIRVRTWNGAHEHSSLFGSRFWALGLLQQL